MFDNNIILNKTQVENPVNSLHFLPCLVCYDGEAKVKEYFECKIKQDKNSEDEKQLETVLYGRKIKGQQKALPDNIQGVIYEKQLVQSKIVQKAIGSFKNFIEWKHNEFNDDQNKELLIPFLQIQQKLHSYD